MPARLRRSFAVFPGTALTISLALTCGGCSFSYQLDSLFGKGKDDPGPAQTGSIQQAMPRSAAVMPPENDMVVARAAVSDVLSKGGKGTSMPWENPSTGARGTITPIASAYSSDNGLTCHDFLASYVRNGTESWLQGEACRVQQGKWEVRHMKPWQRT